MMTNDKKDGIDIDRIFIIAEAGVNHNGDLQMALRMVDEAKKAGVDAIKFQTFVTEDCISRYAGLAEYQKKTMETKLSQFEMAKKLELSFPDFIFLKRYCDGKKLIFLSTPDEEKSLNLLCDLDVIAIKVGSGELTNLPFLRTVARKGKPVILSTGMSNIAEVSLAVDIIYSENNYNLTLLHTTTEYPAPIEEVNLTAMLTLKNTFKVKVGYSDHTEGIAIPIAAAALGASVIEKHFTLSRNLEGPDHKASIEPDDLRTMVDSIRKVEKALGNGLKKVGASEAKNIDICRKSLIAAKELDVGEIISEKDLKIKKPGYGIQPNDIQKVMGLSVKHKILEDEVITWEKLK